MGINSDRLGQAGGLAARRPTGQKRGTLTAPSGRAGHSRAALP
jgi:hypothetical protein